MKKRYFISMAALMLFINLRSDCWSVGDDLQLAISAQSGILMNAASGEVLFEKNAEQPRLIASLTKIMTAIVAIDYGKMDELVTIGPNAVGVEGSSIYLKLNEKISLRTLLYGLMLRSGNDAAIAIAEHIGGSVEGFVYLMNQKAEHLGLKNTHFTNPHGLDHAKHYSSAKDLALITSCGMKSPIFKEIVGTKEKVVSWPGEEWNRTFHNKNKMLSLYPGADGVKTGYTKKAHRTLVSSATRGGVQLISVTLDDGNDWEDSMRMFDYGFKQYNRESLIEKGSVVFSANRSKVNRGIDIVTASSFPYVKDYRAGEKIILEPVLCYPLASVHKEGVQVGIVRIYCGGQFLGTVSLESKFATRETMVSCFKTVFSYALGQVGAQ